MLFVILSSLLPVFGIMLLGFLTARHCLLPVNAATCLNLYVYWIALPCMFFTQLVLMDTERLSGGLFAGIYAGLLAAYLPCFFLQKSVARQETAQATIAACVATFPNVMFMAVPIVSFLLPGEQDALFIASLAALLYLPVMLYTDTALEMDKHRGERFTESLRALAKTLAHNPSIIAPVCGLVLNLYGLGAPTFLTNMTGMLGNTAAPCALFAMGMVLHRQLTSTRTFSVGQLLRQFPVHLTKLFLMPLFTFIALRWFGISGIPLGVAVLCSGMPTAVAANVLAEKHQVAVEDTSLSICLNTAASIASLSLLIALLFTMNVF